VGRDPPRGGVARIGPALWRVSANDPQITLAMTMHVDHAAGVLRAPRG